MSEQLASNVASLVDNALESQIAPTLVSPSARCGPNPQPSTTTSSSMMMSVSPARALASESFSGCAASQLQDLTSQPSSASMHSSPAVAGAIEGGVAAELLQKLTNMETAIGNQIGSISSRTFRSNILHQIILLALLLQFFADSLALSISFHLLESSFVSAEMSSLHHSHLPSLLSYQVFVPWSKRLCNFITLPMYPPRCGPLLLPVHMRPTPLFNMF